MFSVKGHRSVVNKSKLAEAGESVDWFFGSGIMELGDKLGPILWQLAPFKRFNADDIAAFFSVLPKKVGGRAIQHVIEPRHESSQTESFVDLARSENIAIAKADSIKYRSIDDLTGSLVYARLQNTAADQPAGYSETELDRWAWQAKEWAAGNSVQGTPLLVEKEQPQARPVSVYVINGAKERSPAAAMSIIDRLNGGL